MKIISLTRRQFLLAGGLAAAGGRRTLLGGPNLQSETLSNDQPTIHSLRRLSDSLFCFDPVGLFVEPGETIRYLPGRMGFTTLTAYHPDHDNHELRIPEAAEPFDFGFPEQVFFDWVLEVEGTYDFFSKHQEVLGMVGRIVVGRPGGPGEKPWGYGGREGRNPIYKGVHKPAEILDSR